MATNNSTKTRTDAYNELSVQLLDIESMAAVLSVAAACPCDDVSELTLINYTDKLARHAKEAQGLLMKLGGAS